MLTYDTSIDVFLCLLLQPETLENGGEINFANSQIRPQIHRTLSSPRANEGMLFVQEVWNQKYAPPAASPQIGTSPHSQPEPR